jgi:hypothetical protein
MKTSTDIPLILKQPMHPFHRHILYGGDPESYPGDGAYPKEMAMLRAWEQAMREQELNE